jgi:hypothetical protein
MSLVNFMISKRKKDYLIEYLILNTVLFALLNFLGEFLGKKNGTPRAASYREVLWVKDLILKLGRMVKKWKFLSFNRFLAFKVFQGLFLILFFLL